MSSKDFTIEENVSTFDESTGDDNDTSFWSYSNLVQVTQKGHNFGAHFNPAVTIAFSLFHHFPTSRSTHRIHYREGLNS
ncbi:hypothetical protein Leryth_022141 [Lithospermum erythrorhizon]|nr:hypothetical protein Leryth_022141 [Lithospermum erythrorhizon]